MKKLFIVILIAGIANVSSAFATECNGIQGKETTQETIQQEAIQPDCQVHSDGTCN